MERKSTTIKKHMAIQGYIRSGSNARLACRYAGIQPSTFYKWQQDDPLFSQQIEAILYGIKECGEDKLLAAAMGGDLTAWVKKVAEVKKKLNNRSLK